MVTTNTIKELKLKQRAKINTYKERVRSLTHQLKTAAIMITEEKNRSQYCADNGIVKIPANVFQAIESQLAPRFRFKEKSLVEKDCPHIALTDGKQRIAILIPLKY